MTRPLALLLLLALTACGYRPLHASGAEGARLHVALVRSLVADSVAADEVLSGLRDALVEGGALAGGAGYPRVEVEVLRIDTAAVGIASDAAASAPHARGLELGVTARAWVTSAPGAPPQQETGDMRALVVVGEETGAARSATSYPDAARAAARRLGRRLGARVLGNPAASDDGV
jgi:hypothetical protein